VFFLAIHIFPQLGRTETSPPDLNSDINWNAGYSDEGDIEQAYNYARRQEEIQLGVATNALGDLSLPGGWSGMSDNAKALFILNDERSSRAVLYGDAGITPNGITFEGIECNIVFSLNLWIIGESRSPVQNEFKG
jgi:hypothetical protein